MHLLWRFVIARRLLLLALPLLAGLALLFPGTVRAHTLLLRTDPVNGAVVRSPPHWVRLWFSAAVNPVFSTAIVENSAHEYINDRDARISSIDAREMEIHLRSYLPPGVYAVVWRAVSNADGLILSSSFFFAITRPDGTLPGHFSPGTPTHSAPSLQQFNRLPLILLNLLILIPLLILAVTCCAGAAHLRIPRWLSLLSIGVLLCLGLLAVVRCTHPASSTSSPPALHFQQSNTGLLSTFHAALRTSDSLLIIILDVHINSSGPSMFTVSAANSLTGRPITNVHVTLITTMLEMHMGTSTTSMLPAGMGHFTAQSDLSMGGIWQIAIQLLTADHRLHESTIKILTSLAA